jgi:hydrogenase/urease accessory protein HupE
LAVLAASLGLASGAASAHLLPAQNATLHIVDDKVYAVVSVPVSALTGVDEDGDGLLSGAELARHHESIAQQFLDRFHLTAAGDAGRMQSTWVVSPQTGGGPLGPSPYVVILLTAAFPSPVHELELHTDLFGRNVGEGKLILRASRGAIRGGEAELAVLDPRSPTHVFFRGGWSTFTDFVRVGVEHILTGGDHLLFLLTIMIASANWRYWIRVVTSFTLAHSITLTLSALGLMHVSARLVEPAIAASIVLLAIHNIARPGAASWGRVAAVFACGLLHGLGFASALGDLGVDGAHRIATLAGFNVGVEIGQFTFLAALLLVLAGVRLATGREPARYWPRAASATAAVLGCVLLIQRIA